MLREKKKEREEMWLVNAEGMLHFLSSCLVSPHCLSTVKGNLGWLSCFILS